MGTHDSIPAAGDRLVKFLPEAAMGDQGEQTGFSFKLSDLRAMGWRQRRIVGIVLGASLLLGLVVTLLITPQYQATSKVRVDNENVKIISGQDIDPTVSVSDTNRYLNTQALILQSRTMALAVTQDLKLAKDDSFLKAMRARPVDEAVPPAQRQSVRENIIVGLLLRNLKVTVPLDSRVMTIDFLSPDPGVAAAVANSYANKLVANNVQRGLDANSYARRILTDQISAMRAELDIAEHKAIDYARANHLIDASDASGGGSGASDEKNNSAGSGNSQSITTANLVHLNGQYTDAVTQRILAEQRWRQAQTASPMQLPEVQTNSEIQALVGQRATLEAQLAQLNARYAPDFPAVKQARAQLEAVDRQVAQQVANVRNTLGFQYKVALQQEQSLAKAREQLSSDTLQEQSRRVQLNLMARDIDSMRRQLNDLMERYNQISAASDIVRNNISLVDLAVVPTAPVSPNLPKYLGVALVIGLGLSLLLVIAREAMDDTLRSPDDVETKLRLPLLGTTPLSSSDEISRAGQDRKSALTEAYYSIRASLDYASSTGTPGSLQVTSSQPSEGKSTTSTALAQDYARIGKKVLLVDADLRRPTLHRVFNVHRNLGFVDVLLGHKELGECLAESTIENLDILPLGQVPPNPVEILSSNVIGDFLRKHKPLYDLIILDSAPIMGLADAPLIARQVEAVVLIVEANRAHHGQAKAAVRRLQDVGAKVVGVVLTKFDHRIAGYNYDYHYKYYRYESERPEE